MGLRDRLLTPAGARAVTAPSAILLAGAGTAAAIVGGLPLAAAAGVGAAAYLARVALGLPKGPERVDIRPDRLREPWAGHVREALDVRQRYHRAVAASGRGAIRERLVDIGSRVDDGVDECWRIAQRGQQLDAALAGLPPVPELRRRLAVLPPDAAAGTAAGGVASSLRSQLASTERIAALAADTRERLLVLDARLDEAVARAVELSLGAGDAAQLSGLGSDVDALVGDMEALRQALDETRAAGTGL